MYKRLAYLMAIASTFFALAGSSTAQPCSSPRLFFKLAVTQPTSQLAPDQPSIGDFNRDGISDVVVSNFSNDNITVALGNGLGGFSSITNIAVGDGPLSIAIGDFNRNGIQDLAVLNFNAVTISILNGNGNGGFVAATPVSAATGIRIAVGDFNGDGKHDIVSGGVFSGRIFLGNGASGFAAPLIFSISGGTSAFSVGDINRDGKDDLVFTQQNDDRVAIFLGNGDGTFGAQTNFGVGDGPLDGLLLADLNRDGNLDIVTANLLSDNLSVLLGNGAGSFGAVTNFGVADQPRTIAIGDFNGDNIPDIVNAHGGSGVTNISILQGNGSGGFSAPNNFTVGNQNTVAVGEFNRDGKDDVFISTLSTTSTLGVLQNACGGLTQKPPVDFDADGISDFGVFRPTEGTWYLQRSTAGFTGVQFGTAGDIPVAADYDGDGVTDIALWRPSNGTWYLLRSTAGFTGVQFGKFGDIPAPGDADGDGKTDIRIFRPTNGYWYRLNSSNGQFVAEQFGANVDIPIR